MLPNPDKFLDQLFLDLEQNAVNVSCLLLDHICYRVASEKSYQSMKHQLKTDHYLLTESIINGRPIATFLLKTPFAFQNRNINCLELPSPKPGSPYSEGYEHIEFVIKVDFPTLIKKHNKLKFDTKGMNKDINPDIRLSLPSGSVKFHHHPLEHVIRYLD